MFSNKDLRNLIVPFFLEQLLMALVGMADVFVVGLLGEAVSQLLLAAVLFSVAISVVVLLAKGTILRFMFGRVEDDVMAACVTYLRISAYSYPALAVYNAGAALYRSFGKTSTTMYLSIASNIINVVGNCIGVFWLHAGVAGVAWPSLLARMFSAVVITFFCFSEKNPVRYGKAWIFRLDGSLQKIILRIAVPNGIESGIFQLVKVALSSVAALFGTYQIAANGVAQSIWSVASLVASIMGPVFITVIGQCMGAGDISQAEQYFRKLTKITVGYAIILREEFSCLESITNRDTINWILKNEYRRSIMEHLPKRITENGIDYILVGDYYIPDLRLPEESRPIGRWGRMHRDYLKEWRPVLYNDLLLSGRFWTYLADLNEQAQNRLEVITEQMKAAEGITEELKRRDWLLWVQSMNNIRSRAEEIICTEMIFC